MKVNVIRFAIKGKYGYWSPDYGGPRHPWVSSLTEAHFLDRGDDAHVIARESIEGTGGDSKDDGPFQIVEVICSFEIKSSVPNRKFRKS